MLYTDGTCESLELAIDTRKEERNDTAICHKPVITDSGATNIQTPTYFKTPDGRLFLAYFTKSAKKNATYMVLLRIEPESLQIMEAATRFRIARDDQGAELNGYAVVDGLMGANLVTICMCSAAAAWLTYGDGSSNHVSTFRE